MCTQALTGLRDYLTATLSFDDMNWLAAELAEYASKEEHTLKRYTREELNAMLDVAEAEIAAGKVIDDENAWDELDEALAHEKESQMAGAV